MSVRIVGGGISGISCAVSLNAAGVAAELSDRGRALGGRMAARTLRDTGTHWDGHVTDIGASYFTASDPAFRAEVQRWVDAGWAREWTDTFHVADSDGIVGVKSGPMRFTATAGLRSVVQQLAGELPATRIRSGHAVEAISVGPSGVLVDGDEADAVALCLPIPQARRLLPEDLAEAISADRTVAWEPVIAVTLVFDETAWAPFDGIFVNDDPVLTWIANDGSRRADGAPVLVAHVHPVLSARHLEQPAEVLPMAIAAVRRILGSAAMPAWADAHRWTYARPLGANPGDFHLLEQAPIGLAGDAYAQGPRVEAAWCSGRALGLALAGR